MRHSSHHCPSVTWGGRGGRLERLEEFCQPPKKPRIVLVSSLKVDFQKLLCKFVYLCFVVFDFWILKMTDGYAVRFPSQV